MKMMSVLLLLLANRDRIPALGIPLLSSHAGRAAKQGKGSVRRALMKLPHLPFHLISAYALARFRLSLFGFVISIGRERIRLLPGKGLDPTKQWRCLHVSHTSSGSFPPHQNAREKHGSPRQMLAVQHTISYSQILTSSRTARAQIKVLS